MALADRATRDSDFDCRDVAMATRLSGRSDIVISNDAARRAALEFDAERG